MQIKQLELSLTIAPFMYDADGFKRPVPPTGYQRLQTRIIQQKRCLICKEAEVKYSSGGEGNWGFTDPEAQKAYHRAKQEDYLDPLCRNTKELCSNVIGVAGELAKLLYAGAAKNRRLSGTISWAGMLQGENTLIGSITGRKRREMNSEQVDDKKQKKPKKSSGIHRKSKAGDLLKFVRTWAGEDLEECLQSVYDNRSEAEF